MTTRFNGTIDHAPWCRLPCDEFSFSDVSIKVLEGRLRHLVRTMHVVEVRSINRVLAHLLHVRIDFPGVNNHIAPVRVIRSRLWDDLGLPGGRLFVRVIPNQNLLVNLAYLPGTQDRLTFSNTRRQIVGIGNMCALAVAIPAPAMEWALNTIAHNAWALSGLFPDAVAKVRAHVRAEGVYYLRFTTLCSEYHQFLPEVFNRDGIANLEFMRVEDLEPAHRHRKWTSC